MDPYATAYSYPLPPPPPPPPGPPPPTIFVSPVPFRPPPTPAPFRPEDVLAARVRAAAAGQRSKRTSSSSTSWQGPIHDADLDDHPPRSSSASSADSLRPGSIARMSPANHLVSPSDIVGPSPVTSNGTEATEIEDEESEEASKRPTAANPGPQPSILMLSTNISDSIRHAASEEAVSVIHAPESFQSWTSNDSTILLAVDHADGASTKAENMFSPDSGIGVTPDATPIENEPSDPSIIAHPTRSRSSLMNPPPISTDVNPVRYTSDTATPRAQNLQEVQFLIDPSRIRSSSTSSLELIPEARETETDAEPDDDEDETLENSISVVEETPEESEIRTLQTALYETWTLCNTLASLSTSHRDRVFRTSGTPDQHVRAWKCCWKLCQRLYEFRHEESEAFDVRANLDLCRDFCQSLFDVRQRNSEVADSVLRVSFELNNHLYTAQDGNLPIAFRERTLDFYITLCHRLMKQRSELAEETDHLLRACWALAEMLFSLRQNRRDGRPSDPDLIGSAVQACWELCDLFREGWTQIRPDRGTPRPSQTHFFSGGASYGSSYGGGSSTMVDSAEQPPSRSRASTTSRSSLHSKRTVGGGDASSTTGSVASKSSASGLSEQRTPKPTPPPPPPHHHTPQHQHLPHPPPHIPETPVTEFEDTPISPQSRSPQVPNIMVLGTVPPSSAASEALRTIGGGGVGSVGMGITGPQGGNGQGQITGGGARWSSSMSSYSQGSNKTSSTATTTTTAEDINVTRIKTLILKAAMNVGFDRDGAAAAAAAAAQAALGVSAAAAASLANSNGDGSSSVGGSINGGSAVSTATATAAAAASVSGLATAAALQAYVKSLPTGSFGSLPSHATLLQNYKNLVLADSSLRVGGSNLPAKGRKVTAYDMARSVAWMMSRSSHYAFLKDLFKLAFGFHIEEAEAKRNVSILV